VVAIITNKFRLEQAKIFKEDLDDTSPTADNYYLFVARPQEWNTAPVNPDQIPDTPSDTIFSERRTWENMLGMKKILPGNSSFVIPRWNWDASGDTVYVAYSDQDPNMFQHPTPAEILDGNLNGYTPGSFYVMNQYFQVFKCIYNNAGEKSLVEPVADESQPLLLLTLADGYVWKYMYTIQTGDALKFLTDSWMPVKTLLVDDLTTQWAVQSGALSNGVVDSIQVVSPGSGYNRVLDTTTVENIGTVGPNQALGVPSSIASTNNAWYSGATLWVVAGTGLGTYSKIINYLGATKQFVLENTLTVDLTTQFQVLPTVDIVGDGTGAVARANVNFISPVGVESVTLVSPGTGYNYAVATVVGGISGTNYAQLAVVLPPESGHGADPVTELGGSYVMVSASLSYNEGTGDFPISNDYRQIGLIKNPEEFNNPSVLFTGLTGQATSRLTVNTVVGAFTLDALLTESSPGSAIGFLVEVLGSDLVYIQDTNTGFDSFTIGNTVTSVGGASAVISALVNPEVQKYTGEIIYFENRRPIVRDPNQLERIRVIIAF
jgi:hypothetical protein